MIEGQEHITAARAIAVADGQVDQFDRSIGVAIRLTDAQNNRELRVSLDRSLPKHSLLAVIVNDDGSHFYTLGIVRHGDGSWSTHS